MSCLGLRRILLTFIARTKNTETFFKKIIFCVPQKKESHRFSTTWGWVNDDKSFCFCVNFTFKGVCVCVCVCFAVHSCAFDVGLCEKVWWVWLNACVKMYMCVTMCVSGRRSELLCLSWLTLIMFSGLKLFSWVANRHDTCTHADAHTLFSYLHSSSLPTAKTHH